MTGLKGLTKEITDFCLPRNSANLNDLKFDFIINFANLDIRGKYDLIFKLFGFGLKGRGDIIGNFRKQLHEIQVDLTKNVAPQQKTPEPG